MIESNDMSKQETSNEMRNEEEHYSENCWELLEKRVENTLSTSQEGNKVDPMTKPSEERVRSEL